MQIIKTLSYKEVVRIISQVERTIGRTVFEKSFGIKPDERVLVITDPQKMNEASVFFESGKRYTKNISLIVFEGMTENAQEPPVLVADAMKDTDIAILVTHYSLSHTQARKAASEAGVRLASLPGITLEVMQRTLISNPREYLEVTNKIAELLTNHETVEITSPAGTNLTLSIQGRNGIPDTGIIDTAGEFGNLPGGESFIAPVEGTALGTIVVDGAIAEIDLDKPVTLTIKNGAIANVAGGKGATEFEKKLNEAGPKARILCELGIGTNPTATLNPNVLEAEKVYGTCHIAFGNNAGFGGTNSVHFHRDCVLTQPRITLDGKPIMENGIIL